MSFIFKKFKRKYFLIRNDMRKIIWVSSFLILLFLIGSTYLFYRAALDISLDREIPSNNYNSEVKKEVIYFGVVSRYAPNLIYKGYQPIMDYLSEVTPYKFELKLSSSYKETIQQLSNNQVTAAFLGTFIYLDAHEKYGITCIARPLNKNLEPFFHSVLISRSDSPIQKVKDLYNSRLALPSAYSFSGNWLLKSEFKKSGMKQSDLDSIYHFNYHHTVVYQVLKENFHAGVVKDRVAAEFLDHGLRIIKKSDPIPASPIVVSMDANPEVVNAIRMALLGIDVNNPEHAKMIGTWDKEFAFGFQEANNSDYDSLRQSIKSWNKM